MRAVLIAVAVTTLLPAFARADAGVAPVWDDFQPAVSTQYRPPDGGRRYPNPNTAQLQRAQDRTSSDRSMKDNSGKASRPLPPGTPTDPATKPPDQVGR